MSTDSWKRMKSPKRKVSRHALNAKWSTEGLVRILQNEKYCGNAILQKTYKRDFLSRRVANNGEVRKYLVENGYEAIITPEQFEIAQQELEARRKENRQHSSKSIFTSKLVCGDCGCFYGSKVSTPPTNTEVSYGSTTTSSKLTRSVPLHTSRKV